MATFEYKATRLTNPPPSPHSAGEVMVSSGEATIDASLAQNDLVALCKLPPGCVPMDFTLFSTDLESTSTTIVCHVGFAKTTEDDLIASTLFIQSTTVCQAGGIDKPDATDLVLRKIRAKNVDRIIALKVKTAAAASKPVAGYIRGDLTFRAAEQGEWSTYPNSVNSNALV